MSLFAHFKPKASEIATFIGTTGFFTPASSATDIFELKGSASKTVKVLRVLVYYTCTTTANPNNFLLKIGTAAGSGGTSVATTFVKTDSSSAAVSATAKHYTANPTIATATTVAVGNWAGNSTANTAASVQSQPLVLFDAHIFGAPIVLRGTSEVLVVNNNGVTFPNTANSVAIVVVFTEE